MYRTIETSFWTDPKVRKLPAGTKLLFLYLITNNHTHVSGIYYLPNVVIHHETGIPLDRLDSSLDTLSGLGLVRRDKENEVVWVVNMLRYQGAHKKTLQATAKQLKTLHNCPLVKDFVDHYRAVKTYFRDRVSVPYQKLAEDGPVSLQEQEQELNTKTPNGVLSASADAAKVEDGGKVNKPDRARKQASGGHHELIRCFCDGWKARYQVAYRFVEGKDGRHVQWLLKGVGGDVDEARQIVNAYFADNDPFVAEKRHPLGILVSNFNRYRAVPPPVGDLPIQDARPAWQKQADADMERAIDEALAGGPT